VLPGGEVRWHPHFADYKPLTFQGWLVKKCHSDLRQPTRHIRLHLIFDGASIREEMHPALVAFTTVARRSLASGLT